MKINNFQIRETVELEVGKTLEILESAEQYSLPEIAEKLTSGKKLNKIERQMASATILDWIRLKESQTGRPKKWNSIQEKNKYYNDKRRGKLSER